MENWHALPIEAALKKTGSQPSGLSAAQSAASFRKHGRNELLEKKRRPAWLMFLAQFRDTMILILLAAAAVSGIIGDLSDTIVILIIVFLNAVVGFVQEYRAEKAMEALKKMAPPLAKVLRDGLPVEMDAAELAPGDIVLLETGNLVPADLRLIESVSLKIEEASLTGESQAVEKQTEPLADKKPPLGDRTNMAYKSTVVSYGRGAGLVVATGMATEIGQIAQLLQEEDGQTPLQTRLASFSKKLSVVVIGICAVIFGIGLLRGIDKMEMLLTAISVAVAGIPEALPAVVTVALALGARRLVAKKALIRKLPAVETLGSVTFICTDKTGTLTQNRMTVTETFAVENAPDGLGLSPIDGLLLCMALNHDVKKDEKGKPVGEPTELALAAFSMENLKSAKPEDFPRVAELPFDAERKMMTTVHKFTDGKFLIITKGALESVQKICEKTDPKAAEEAKKMAQNGLRVIAYAARLVGEMPSEITFENLEKQMHGCGLAGLMDPPRKEAAAAIADCKKAGIVAVMITGDHPETAAAIARQIGILAEEADEMLTGAELDKLSEAAFLKKVERTKVYARVSPAQKLRIIKALQAKKHFVAMTGDGVNDAPALRRADIGVAMGITGSDVTKEAADMILLDDNFATILKSVKEGRRIFENIRKSVKFLLTGNSGEMWVIFGALAVGLPIPLLPIHILWINLVSDGLPALALTAEPAEKDSMKKPPRPPGESLFANGLGWHVGWVGFLIGAICLAVQFFALKTGDPKGQTYVFTVLCFSQMTYVFAIRSERESLFRQGFFTNLPLLFAVLITMGLQLLVIYVPFLQEVFSVEALSWKELAACFGVSTVVFFAVEMEKLVRGRRQSKGKNQCPSRQNQSFQKKGL